MSIASAGAKGSAMPSVPIDGRAAERGVFLADAAGTMLPEVLIMSKSSSIGVGTAFFPFPLVAAAAFFGGGSFFCSGVIFGGASFFAEGGNINLDGRRWGGGVGDLEGSSTVLLLADLLTPSGAGFTTLAFLADMEISFTPGFESSSSSSSSDTSKL